MFASARVHAYVCTVCIHMHPQNLLLKYIFLLHPQFAFWPPTFVPTGSCVWVCLFVAFGFIFASSLLFIASSLLLRCLFPFSELNVSVFPSRFRSFTFLFSDCSGHASFLHLPSFHFLASLSFIPISFDFSSRGVIRRVLRHAPPDYGWRDRTPAPVRS